jgi:hypothetical protein
MIRDSLRNHYIGMNKEFRYRGEEQTRLETFSDAVFALAVTLLLISSTPPITFYQLQLFTKDLIPFALCITLLALIWFEHFRFFFRYGFRNVQIVVLNTLFLIIVLFYVYPLKFLCKLLVIIFGNLLSMLFGYNPSWEEYLFMMEGGSQSALMTIYGIGGASVFLVLAIMYAYAYRMRNELNLNLIEIFDTKTSIMTNIYMASVPLLSVTLAISLGDSNIGKALSGFCYFLYFPVMFTHGFRTDKARKKLLQNVDNQR